MKTVCSESECAGCMLCPEICSAGAIRIEAGIDAYNAVIDEEKCHRCGRCHALCPQNRQPKLRAPIFWSQGWCADDEMRAHSSSGGLATAIAVRFMKDGGEVCACRFEGGRFGFTFFRNAEEFVYAAGSKYVKSDPSGIYKPLLEKLKVGKRVLMIGLPCQIAAAINLAGETYAKNLYTIDLICHGTPSPDVLQRYLCGKGIELNGLEDIRFRMKAAFGLRDGYRLIENRYMDEYTYAFLHGYTYTRNCYQCRYAQLERIADITLGDSWGSELAQEEQEKGLSLVLCQSEKGKRLVEASKLELRPVELEAAVRANKQLSASSEMPAERRLFLSEIQKGRSFFMATLKVDPVRCVKNVAKMLLRRKGTGGGTVYW